MYQIEKKIIIYRFLPISFHKLFFSHQENEACQVMAGSTVTMAEVAAHISFKRQLATAQGLNTAARGDKDKKNKKGGGKANTKLSPSTTDPMFRVHPV